MKSSQHKNKSLSTIGAHRLHSCMYMYQVDMNGIEKVVVRSLLADYTSIKSCVLGQTKVCVHRIHIYQIIMSLVRVKSVLADSTLFNSLLMLLNCQIRVCNHRLHIYQVTVNAVRLSE